MAATRLGFTAAAAAVVVAAAYSALAWSRSRAAIRFEAAEFSTGPSELATVTLGDGTVVRLAPESRLRVLPAAGERAVWLAGQAYFAVAKRPTRFVVRTPAGEAVALGTRFDLRVRHGELELLVVEGRVALAAGDQRVEVGEREMGRVSRPGTAVVVHSVDLGSRLRWMGDFLVFQSTPLGNAAMDLSEHYRVPVQILDPTLERETVSGVFSNEPLEDVVKVLCRAVRARCVIDQSRVTMEP